MKKDNGHLLRSLLDPISSDFKRFSYTDSKNFIGESKRGGELPSKFSDLVELRHQIQSTIRLDPITKKFLHTKLIASFTKVAISFYISTKNWNPNSRKKRRKLSLVFEISRPNNNLDQTLFYYSDPKDDKPTITDEITVPHPLPVCMPTNPLKYECKWFDSRLAIRHPAAVINRRDHRSHGYTPRHRYTIFFSLFRCFFCCPLLLFV